MIINPDFGKFLVTTMLFSWIAFNGNAQQSRSGIFQDENGITINNNKSSFGKIEPIDPIKNNQIIKLSLENAIHYGMTRRYELQAQRLQMDLQDKETQKVKTRQLPTITGSADMRFNTQLQTNIIPGGVISPSGETKDRVVQFGRTYNNVIALSLNQPIYQPTLKSDKEVSIANRELEGSNLKKLELDLKLLILNAYYNVLWMEKKMQLDWEGVQRAQNYHLTAKNKFTFGTLLKTELDKYELDVLNALTTYRRDSTGWDLAKKNLIYQIGFDQGTKIQTTEKLENLMNSIDTFLSDPNLSTKEQNISERVEIEQEKARLKVNNLMISREKKTYRPTISLYGNYSLQELNNKFNPFDTKNWFAFNYIGLNLNVPIFDGFLKERNKESFKIKSEINNINIKRMVSDFNFEVASSKSELSNVLINYKYARENYEVAKRVLNTEQVKYKSGTLLYADLRNSEYALQQAETNLLNSLFDYLNAELKWKKATGQL